jgi:heptosyltransferase-3
MALSPFDRRPPQRILVTCTLRIGDVLLATPLVRSLKQAWPQAELHFLALQGMEGALEGNPDIARVIAFPHRTNWRGKLAQLRELWRRYDLAVGAIASDRVRFYGWAASSFRIGFIDEHETGKTFFLNRWLMGDVRDTHTVAHGLRLCELLGIAPHYGVVPPSLSAERRDALLKRLRLADDKNYAVLHPYPKYTYKMWRQEGWVELARWLQERGLRVLLTGGPDREERSYADAIASQTSAENLAGELSLAETAEIIAPAKLFVGPDTAVTHIAAATGAPTVALFGPSNPVKWGPWPQHWNRAESPWHWRGSARQDNVYLMQGPGDCVPCLMEGCDRHVASSSACLQRISSSNLISVAESMLKDR